ncbi:hypothetical protein C7I87_22170 [Mesorhizobium sp. SARCC-RB16n]|uniref:ATP-grasp domain-containing protein n=1 Tax=Mesorhizobium sp. SARCC-RB16n TaxID=2116687 RepID=UPI00122F9E92|nr:acetyl-CoA carboxylase biotin carboxylase subunit family protein [Mesorhizobium sp. SARCC-RB16n]KAA3448420.1 hypothetical protein C7I87_22170 [Mesorhizobium sp. SARCC-RB16n]
MATRALILLETTRSNGAFYVKAAQRLGLHPIMLSSDPDRYGISTTEDLTVVRVDTGNINDLILQCSQLRESYEVAGITSATESFYSTVGKLCRFFDLPGPNSASVEQCCDKLIQRKLLSEAGVPIPAYSMAANAAEVRSSAAEIGLPVILKPSVGSGGRGVRLCRDADEVSEHAAYLLAMKHNWRSSPEMLVEEFAQGTHYFAAIMGDEVLGIGAAEYGPPPYFVFRRLIFPAVLTDDEQNRLREASMNCLRALGLGWGPTNIEFRWTKHGPVVIEVNPRLAGAPDPQLLQLAFGVDLFTEHIKLAIGDEWDLRKKHSRTAIAQSLIADGDGTLEWISGDSQAAALPGIAEVRLYVQPRCPIVNKGDNRDRMGYVVGVSPCLAQTEEIVQRAIDLIGWSITPFSTAGEEEQFGAPDFPD